MKKILAIVALLALMAGTANATALTGTVARFGSSTTGAPGVAITWSAALTSSDTGTAVWSTDGLMSYFDGGSGTVASAIAWGFLSTTAGDSAQIAINGSMSASGPWQAIYVSTLQANTLTGAVNVQARDDLIATLKPYRYHQMVATGKGASMATTKTFYVVYPRVRP